MPNFKLSKRAKSDLLAIAHYSENEWGKAQRNHYLLEINRTFQKLSKRPSLGQTCDYIREGYRKMPQGKHIIFYKQETSGDVLIVRIMHKRMDVPPKFK